MIILLVEDCQFHRGLISHILIREGHALLIAETGEQGIEMLEHHVVDYVLTDKDMHVLDGFAVIIAANKLKPTPKIWLMSNVLKDGDTKRALEFGAHKVVDKDHLLRELKQAGLIQRSGQVKT